MYRITATGQAQITVAGGREKKSANTRATTHTHTRTHMHKVRSHGEIVDACGYYMDLYGVPYIYAVAYEYVHAPHGRPWKELLPQKQNPIKLIAYPGVNSNKVYKSTRGLLVWHRFRHMYDSIYTRTLQLTPQTLI